MKAIYCFFILALPNFYRRKVILKILNKKMSLLDKTLEELRNPQLPKVMETKLKCFKETSQEIEYWQKTF